MRKTVLKASVTALIASALVVTSGLPAMAAEGPTVVEFTPANVTEGFTSWTVPENVCGIHVTALGANGQDSNLAPGGLGAAVVVNLTTKPGTVLKVAAGAQGAAGGAPGAGKVGLAGGGYSGLFESTDNSKPLVVAGGGGGAGSVKGGNAERAGSNLSLTSGITGGGPGTATAGGAGGKSVSPLLNGLDGASYSGGSAADATSGGGGGGFFGGGGGGATPTKISNGTGSGGGGGSSFPAAGSRTLESSTIKSGQASANGSLTIKYDLSGADACSPDFAPTFTSEAPAAAKVGDNFSYTYTSTGFPKPTYAVTAGTLPAGLSLDAATGVLSGTPTVAGNASFTVTASNRAGKITKDTVLTVNQSASIAGEPMAGVVGENYAFAYTVSGYPKATVTASGLPAGLTVTSDGVISGKPTAAGTFKFTVKATNSLNEAQVESVITVDPKATTPAEPVGPAVVKPAAGVLSTTSGWANGLADGKFDVVMNLWWGSNATKVDVYENDVLISTQKLADVTPSAQKVTVPVTDRKNGNYVYKAVLTNRHGATETNKVTVKVTNANPGAGVLSNNNWAKAPNYKVDFNMWWGTNGDTYRLYENNVLVDTQKLAASTSPTAQSASTLITGKKPGTYVYRAELSNSAGVTSSQTTTVTVSK